MSHQDKINRLRASMISPKSGKVCGTPQVWTDIRQGCLGLCRWSTSNQTYGSFWKDGAGHSDAFLGLNFGHVCPALDLRKGSWSLFMLPLSSSRTISLEGVAKWITFTLSADIKYNQYIWQAAFCTHIGCFTITKLVAWRITENAKCPHKLFSPWAWRFRSNWRPETGKHIILSHIWQGWGWHSKESPLVQKPSSFLSDQCWQAVPLEPKAAVSRWTTRCLQRLSPARC